MRPNKYFTKMKKIFLFIATATLAFSMNSCSSDDNSDSNGGNTTVGGTITAKIDGVQKTFNNVIVNTTNFTEDGENYTFLDITATIGNSASEIITFSTIKGRVGADAIRDFNYTKNDNFFYSNPMTTIMQTNSDSKKLKGIFSGTLTNTSGGSPIAVTEGSFDIQY